MVVVEGVLLPDSPLLGQSLKSSEFHDRYGLQVLGLNRAGYRLRQKLSRIRMRLGDVLLLQGSPKNVKALEQGNLFSIFGGVANVRLKTTHTVLALTIFAAALIAATFNIVSLPVAAIGGAFLMCHQMHFAGRSLPAGRMEGPDSYWLAVVAWRGDGSDRTGKFLAAQFIDVVGTQNPLFVLATFFVLTVMLTQPMSNQAAAIVIVPIALETAGQLGLNPRSFAMMIAVAASCSYLTPLEPSSLWSMDPANTVSWIS